MTNKAIPVEKTTKTVGKTASKSRSKKSTIDKDKLLKDYQLGIYNPIEIYNKEHSFKKYEVLENKVLEIIKNKMTDKQAKEASKHIYYVLDLQVSMRRLIAKIHYLEYRAEKEYIHPSELHTKDEKGNKVTKADLQAEIKQLREDNKRLEAIAKVYTTTEDGTLIPVTTSKKTK